MVSASRPNSKIAGFIFGVVLVTASILFYPVDFNEKSKSLIAPPPHLEFFSFGLQGVIADNLWIRAIQDFDYCEQKLAENKCRNSSWLYLMLDSITTLAPNHNVAYVDGGVSLSVLVSDAAGASKIYAKGLAIFPNDFNLLYRSGLHAWYEEKNILKAANLYLRAAKAQGLQGTWLYSLAGRLYTDAGQKEVATKLYYQMKEQGLEEQFLKRMREKLGLPEEAAAAPTGESTKDQ